MHGSGPHSARAPTGATACAAGQVAPPGAAQRRPVRSPRGTRPHPTSIPRPPDGVEEVPAMLSRLLAAHETILTEAHEAAARAAELGSDGTNHLLVSQVIRTGELQAWFVAEHLVDTPLVRTWGTTPLTAAAAPAP
ncbi:ferritin-like domain-containing protein [Streptomyces sp. NPDC049687]|uniref:ferritin-like domain-containing protein n=1 Tax=Streptomyces sp. NPDC049687 TaxID=3365596 RepID=UPI00378A3B46